MDAFRHLAMTGMCRSQSLVAEHWSIRSLCRHCPDRGAGRSRAGRAAQAPHRQRGLRCNCDKTSLSDRSTAESVRGAESMSGLAGEPARAPRNLTCGSDNRPSSCLCDSPRHSGHRHGLPLPVRAGRSPAGREQDIRVRYAQPCAFLRALQSGRRTGRLRERNPVDFYRCAKQSGGASAQAAFGIPHSRNARPAPRGRLPSGWRGLPAACR